MGLFGSSDGGRDIAILGRVGSRDGRGAPIAVPPVDEEEENRIMAEDD